MIPENFNMTIVLKGIAIKDDSRQNIIQETITDLIVSFYLFHQNRQVLNP